MRVKLWHEDGTVLLSVQAKNTDIGTVPVAQLSSGDARIYDLREGGAVSLLFMPYPTPVGNEYHGLASNSTPDVWLEAPEPGLGLKAPNGEFAEVPVQGGWFRVVLGQEFIVTRVRE